MMTLFCAVLRDGTGRRSTRLLLAQSLFVLFALSLRASFVPSPDTCSYDNFYNCISLEEIGFTVHLILFLFSRELSCPVFQLNPLWIHFFLLFWSIETRCFCFLSSWFPRINSIITEIFVCFFLVSTRNELKLQRSDHNPYSLKVSA